MSDVVAKSVISLELDDSHMLADLPKAQAILLEFIDRMQKSANITLRADKTKSGKDLIRVDVDPKTTTAGMEVIRKIVKEYTARLNKEAKVTVGVDEKSVGYLQYSFQRLKSSIVDGIGQGIGQAFVFTITRGIERAVLGAAKAPFKLLASSLLAYRTQESAELKLGKAIEATSGQVRKSQAEILKTAKELEKLTGTADTTIIAMQGILAAAKGLSGEGFDRATKAALDLSEVLGGDPVNKAEKLAKALQEPEKALEMLRDEGVSFTKTQQDVVKYFVKINDVASAQGIILDAIESKYYGASTATGTHADEMERLSNEYNSVLETMGAVIAGTDGAFIPALETGISVLDAYTPVIAGTTNAMLELAAAMLDYSIEGDRANLTTEEAIQKASEFSSALKAVGTPSSIWSYVKGKVLRGAQGAAEAFDGLPGSPADKAAKALKEMADEANSVIDKAATEEETKAIANREAKKKRLEAEAAQRRADADKRRVEAEKRLAEAAILAKKDQDQEEAAKLKKKRLKKEEAAEDKRLKEEERARLKAQQDFEKSMGRDSLVGLHQRIQDAMYLRKEEAAKKKQDTAASAVNKGGAAGAASGALASAVAAGVGGFGAVMSAAFSAVALPNKGKKGKTPQTQEEIDADFEKEREKVKKAEAARQRRAAFDARQQEQLDAANTYDDNQKWYKKQADKETQRGNNVEAARLKYQAKVSEIYRQIELFPNGVPLEKDTKLQRELKALDEEYEAAINNKKEKQQAAAKIAQREADAKAAKDKIIADEEARKKAEEDRQAAEQKQIDAFKVRMSPEEEKAFWDKNKPAMDALEKTLNDRNKELQKQQADKKAWDESGGPEKVRQEYEKQRKENEERRRRFSEGRTPEQQDNLRRMLEGLPPLTSATPPSKRKRSFAPEDTKLGFAPEGGDIKVTVKPEQKEVVSSITAQTRALSKAITESRKLT